MNENLFHYRGVIESIYDGDTFTVSIDLGFKVWMRNQKIRLFGVNTPEIRGVERPDGLRVRDEMRALLPVGAEVTLQSIRDKSGKYGRWLGRIHKDDGTCINDMLIAQGYGQDY